MQKQVKQHLENVFLEEKGQNNERLEFVKKRIAEVKGQDEHMSKHYKSIFLALKGP